ncbi:MAG TPA: hypothetical protein VFH78_15430 [Candidatus Thermoplasmatota archaeon]|nr:hypothetical protein [Candidatus Thermoplasmatota archaeon]
MTLPQDPAWEAYRLYQRDLLLQCLDDAELIVRRRHSLFPKEETLMLVQLLFEKRCSPYKYFRDEHRAEQALAKRAGGGAGKASA